MFFLNKLAFIAGSSAVFGFLFFIGNKVRLGEDFEGGGLRGIGRFLIDFLGFLIKVAGQSGAGWLIMMVALFAGIYVAVTIWRDKFFF